MEDESPEGLSEDESREDVVDEVLLWEGSEEDDSIEEFSVDEGASVGSTADWFSSLVTVPA